MKETPQPKQTIDSTCINDKLTITTAQQIKRPDAFHATIKNTADDDVKNIINLITQLQQQGTINTTVPSDTISPGTFHPMINRDSAVKTLPEEKERSYGVASITPKPKSPLMFTPAHAGTAEAAEDWLLVGPTDTTPASLKKG
jgi:hypothetical protein